MQANGQWPQSDGKIELDAGHLKTITDLVDAKIASAAKSTSPDAAEVEKLIKRKIDQFAADRIEKVDWALGTLGGKIVPSRTSEPYVKPAGSRVTHNWMERLISMPSPGHSFDPHTILQPTVSAGECWAFEGGKGHVAVQLGHFDVHVDAVSIDHISPAVAPHPESAPNKFRILGLKNTTDIGAELGVFNYDIKGDSVQTFQLKKTGVFPIVLLDVISNHGYDYTCLYRFRVHGKEIST